MDQHELDQAQMIALAAMAFIDRLLVRVFGRGKARKLAKQIRFALLEGKDPDSPEMQALLAALDKTGRDHDPEVVQVKQYVQTACARRPAVGRGLHPSGHKRPAKWMKVKRPPAREQGKKRPLRASKGKQKSRRKMA